MTHRDVQVLRVIVMLASLAVAVALLVLTRIVLLAPEAPPVKANIETAAQCRQLGGTPYTDSVGRLIRCTFPWVKEEI